MKAEEGHGTRLSPTAQNLYDQDFDYENIDLLCLFDADDLIAEDPILFETR